MRVITDEERCRVYECDGLTLYRQIPGCVVMPDSVEKVCRVMRYCHRHRIPVVARGAGTGLSGGALPRKDGVLLSLARLNRLLWIDPQRRLAQVQAGVSNLRISEQAAPHGLFYAPDPSSQVACSIGGNVAENSGGVHCLKYGLTVNHVRAARMVDVSGELLELGSHAPDSPGYDLMALITGSEGMLGIVVELTVRLLPIPPASHVLLMAFDTVEDAAGTVAAILSAGIIPAGLEMMDQPAVAAVETFVQAGYPLQAAAILICELDGCTEDVTHELKQVQTIAEQHNSSLTAVAQDAAEAAKFWAGRKATFPAAGRLAPDYYCMDGTIPRHRIGAVLRQISALSKEYALAVINVFHAGDGNLHPLILYDAGIAEECKRAEAFGSRILELCLDNGGTITGEHGVGSEKLREMCVQFGEEELVQFHAVRRAFDEHGLLNPGKGVPTLSRCAEFGAMHVHHGQLPFPHLERF